MPAIVVRNLSEETHQALKARAARHERSMEAEVREILDSTVRQDSNFIVDWIKRTEDIRIDFELPERQAAREPLVFD